MRALIPPSLTPLTCITQVAVGAHHTVILDDSSSIYTFGMGDLGQLGACTYLGYLYNLLLYYLHLYYLHTYIMYPCLIV
jgi:hypothetical protein